MRVLVIFAIQLVIVGTALGQRRLENIDALASRPATRTITSARCALNRNHGSDNKLGIEPSVYLWNCETQLSQGSSEFSEGV
jgi:hypothetical protein